MTNEVSPLSPDPVPTRPDTGEEPRPRVSAGRRFLAVLQGTGIFQPEEWPVRTILWTSIGICIFLFLLALLRQGFAHVRENEVGVLADNFRDQLILKDRVGYHFFLPYAANFYELDKTIQKLSLTWDQGPGQRGGRDVKLKTADGNNVSLDITVNFKLVPDKAVEVLQESGLGMRFAETWVEPFTRHACFATFGRLKTEDMYDATNRNAIFFATQKSSATPKF